MMVLLLPCLCGGMIKVGAAERSALSLLSKCAHYVDHILIP